MRNYTSTVDAEDSIFRIEQKLIQFGASHILKEYDDAKQVSALSFTLLVDRETLRRLPIRMPANVEAVRKVLWGQVRPGGNRQQKLAKVAQQAVRTAWKLTLDWLDVQLSMIEMGQAEAAQVFLPYVRCSGERTFYEVIKADGYRALPGLPAPKSNEDIEDAEIS